MKVFHICAGWEKNNGAANIARMIMDEQRREGHDVSFATWATMQQLRTADELWIHCGWLPCLWWAALWFSSTRMRGGTEKILRWMPEACYDPMRLGYHGWKKWLVGPIERWLLRRCDRIVATCEAEKGWIKAYLGKRCPEIEVTDIKRFFKLGSGGVGSGGVVFNNSQLITHNSQLHLLYLGRRHPLKGLEYLEEAVRQISSVPRSPFPIPPQLKIVSNAFGEEKEKVWEWCDVLVLPTLSENFGLVIAEALERGKRVITTDGAPAWESECKMVSVKCKVGGGEIWSGYEGRLLYLKGYRDGSPEVRIALLEDAIINLLERRVECVSG